MSVLPGTVYNTESHEKTSDKYNVIQTSEVIDLFKNNGFSVSGYKESRTMTAENFNKGKHLVRMKLDTDLTSGVDREVVIMNSHNGSSSLKLNFGLFRMVCNNQLVFGDSLLPTERIIHSVRDPWSRIEGYIDAMKSKLEEEQQLRRAMEKRRLTRFDLFQLAERAISIREDDTSKIVDPQELNRIRRFEDKGTDLFTSFNRVQEALINGHYQKEGTFTDEEGKTQPILKKAKIITNPSELIRINKEVHSLYAAAL